ncbi:MAG: hypothetical protein B7Z33_00030 [Sphingomonadales bacterium 12-68-11]|nr:MAG: hypothetical protein B7Z33_00030 [Sphingomonadales bacterium 12-68-11]
MAKIPLLIAAAALAFVTGSALGQGGGSAAVQSPAPLNTRQAMIDGVNPAALAIWDVTNTAVDDAGMLDPALMGAADWTRIEEAALALQDESRRMARAQTIVAGGPDLVSGELPPGVASKGQIQAMIDADPDGFRAVAADMAERAAALIAAAKRRDAAATGDLSAAIDEHCTACHTRYWYLQEPGV